MIKKTALISGITFFLIPTVVWAGFFSRDPVAKALDDYETNRDAARQQMTVTADQGVKSELQGSARVANSTGETKKKHKTFETEAGFESYAYQYRETVGGERFMRMKGVFYGVYLKHTFRPNQLDPLYSDLMDFFRFEARYAWARTNYNGGVTLTDVFGNEVGSAPLDMSHIPDIVLETRFLVGKDLFWRGMTFTPYSGFGFRFLKDDPSDVTGTFTFEGSDYQTNGYTRKSYYYYLPIGLDIEKSLTKAWQIGWNAEFDYLIYGTQKSYSQEENNSVPTNRQDRGYGLRTSLRLEKTSPAIGFQIEPFFRFWDIEDSEWVQVGSCVDGMCPGVLEPSNTTREIGVRMGLTF
jgi:hypothetical protein